VLEPEEVNYPQVNTGINNHRPEKKGERGWTDTHIYIQTHTHTHTHTHDNNKITGNNKHCSLMRLSIHHSNNSNTKNADSNLLVLKMHNEQTADSEPEDPDLHSSPAPQRCQDNTTHKSAPSQAIKIHLRLLKAGILLSHRSVPDVAVSNSRWKPIQRSMTGRVVSERPRNEHSVLMICLHQTPPLRLRELCRRGAKSVTASEADEIKETVSSRHSRTKAHVSSQGLEQHSQSPHRSRPDELAEQR
jgi:hypothetical protein